jgi:hypothetical protein
MRNCLALLAASLMVIAPVAAHARNGWRSVGLQVIKGKGERDTIRVRGDRKDHQIRFCSVNHPFRLHTVEIRFASGGRQFVDVRERIDARDCTRPIDLRGDGRVIDQVELRYSTIGSGLVPLVRVEAR